MNPRERSGDHGCGSQPTGAHRCMFTAGSFTIILIAHNYPALLSRFIIASNGGGRNVVHASEGVMGETTLASPRIDGSGEQIIGYAIKVAAKAKPRASR